MFYNTITNGTYTLNIDIDIITINKLPDKYSVVTSSNYSGEYIICAIKVYQVKLSRKRK